MKLTYEQKCYYTDFSKKYFDEGTFYNVNTNIPYYVTIKPTLGCVANCLHCNPRNKKFERNKVLTLCEYNELFNSLHKMGTKNICFSGGEPLLYKDIVKLVKVATNNKLKVSINTNGYLLNTKIFDELINAGVLSFNISIDSPFSAIHDNLRRLNGLYDKVISNITECKKKREDFILNIRMVLSKYNYKDIDKMIDMALELDADLLSIDLIEADSKNKYFLLTESEINKFKNDFVPSLIDKIGKMNISNKLKKFNIKEIQDIFNTEFNDIKNFENGIYWPDDRIKKKCDIPNTFMIIEGDGNVLPCNAVEYCRENIVGNIFDTKIEQLWNSEKWNEFRKNKMCFCNECPMNMSFMILFKERKIEREYYEGN